VRARVRVVCEGRNAVEIAEIARARGLLQGAAARDSVQAKLAWIQARTADTLGLPLACTHVRDHRVTPTIEYYDCVERPPPPVLTPGLVNVPSASLTNSPEPAAQKGSSPSATDTFPSLISRVSDSSSRCRSSVGRLPTS